MIEREQFRQVCRWNRKLSRENSSLRAEVEEARRENEELKAAMARRDAEAEAAECFLDAAMGAAAEVV